MTKASRVHANARRLRRYGNRVFMPFWIAVVTIMTAAAAAKARWDDALFGLGMIAAGLAFWFVWNVWSAIIGWLNTIFFGPDPEEERNHGR